MKTLVLCNPKGGVGKSAVATLLAHHLAHRGHRVLAIDLDHQGAVYQALRVDHRESSLSSGVARTKRPEAARGLRTLIAFCHPGTRATCPWALRRRAGCRSK